MLATGCVKSRYDDAIFYWHKENTLQGILSAHIDDFCWAGTKLFQNIVINHIRNAFTISKEQLQTFKYLGLSISQTSDGIFMHQNEYIEEIEVVEIDKPNQKDCKLLPHETQQLPRLAGQLNWVSIHTRPGMAYAASVVSSSIKNATVRDLVKANKFIKLLNCNELVLSFPQISHLQNASLVCFSDASFANLKCSGSHGGLLVFLQGRNGKYMLLAWQSRKLKRVVKSTLTAETLALQEVIEVPIMIKAMFLEILNVDAHNEILLINCVTDSKSLHGAVYSTKTLTEEPLKIELCAIQESLEKQEIHSVIWVCSEDLLADCLTKEGASQEKLYGTLSGKVKLLNSKKIINKY